MQAMGQMNENKTKHNTLIINENACYFVTNNCVEDNALLYF